MDRKCRPWFRWNKTRTAGRWYVTKSKKQIALDVTDPADESGAWDALKRLVSQAMSEAGTGPKLRPEPLEALISPFLAPIRYRLSKGSTKAFERATKRLVAQFPGCTAASLDPVAVENQAASEPWSNNYRGNYLWCVQVFVRWAGRKDFTLRRPPKESRGAEDVTDEATHQKILAETTGDFRQLCRFCWAVGCRPGEARGITAEMVDWASGTVRLSKHKTKHKGKQRILYLSLEALAILREQTDRHKSGHLFRGNCQRPFTQRAIVGRFINLSDRIGKRVISYGYRHGFGTRALAQGVPDAIVAELMGHSGTKMLHMHYSHLGQHAEILKEAANRVA